MDVKKYTLAEVAANTGKDGAALWIVHKDSVYDLTEYVYQHPGGVDVMLQEAGTDATKTFEETHSADARTIMKKYKIGEIVEEEKKYDASGKKKKRLVSAPPEETNRGFCSIITCGLVG